MPPSPSSYTTTQQPPPLNTYQGYSSPGTYATPLYPVHNMGPPYSNTNGSVIYNNNPNTPISPPSPGFNGVGINYSNIGNGNHIYGHGHHNHQNNSYTGPNNGNGHGPPRMNKGGYQKSSSYHNNHHNHHGNNPKHGNNNTNNNTNHYHHSQHHHPRSQPQQLQYQQRPIEQQFNHYQHYPQHLQLNPQHHLQLPPPQLMSQFNPLQQYIEPEPIIKTQQDLESIHIQTPTPDVVSPAEPNIKPDPNQVFENQSTKDQFQDSSLPDETVHCGGDLNHLLPWLAVPDEKFPMRRQFIRRKLQLEKEKEKKLLEKKKEESLKQEQVSENLVSIETDSKTVISDEIILSTRSNDNQAIIPDSLTPQTSSTSLIDDKKLSTPSKQGEENEQPIKSSNEESPSSIVPAHTPSPSVPGPKSWAEKLKAAPSKSQGTKKINGAVVNGKSAGENSTQQQQANDSPSKSRTLSGESGSHTPNNSEISSSDSTAVVKKEPLGVVLTFYNYERVRKELKPQVYSRGIVNTGNICFMNSILQALIHLPPFYGLLSYISQNTIFRIKSDTPLLDALIDLMKECTKSPTVKSVTSSSSSSATSASSAAAVTQAPGSGISDAAAASAKAAAEAELRASHGLRNINTQPISPESFYNKVRVHPRFRHYKRGRQEDAEEFLGYLLEALHDEFLASMKSSASLIQAKKDEDEGNEESGAWKEVGKNNKSVSVQQNQGFGETPISKLFGGQLKSILNVSTQKTPSITRDPFQQIQLDISDPDVHSIEDAFVNLAQPEQLQYSTSTKQDVRATKQILIDETPQVLIVHLKRFSYTTENDNKVGGGGGYHGFGESVQKISKPISFPEHLKIPREVVTSAVGIPEPPSYTLQGVVYHHGSSATVGHYTVDVKSHSRSGEGAEEWINIDDISLTESGLSLPVWRDNKEIQEGSSSTSVGLGSPNTVGSTTPTRVSGGKGAQKKNKSSNNNNGVTTNVTTPPWAVTESNKTAYILFYVRDSDSKRVSVTATSSNNNKGSFNRLDNDDN